MPRISANKLGEFLITANPVRRLRILNDQKYPSEVVVPMYRLARTPLADYLQSNGRDEEAIIRTIDRLRSDESGTEWAVRDRMNTAEALERLLSLASALPLQYPTYEIRVPPTASIALTFSGVDVSVRPDFLVFTTRRGKALVGALKFHFTKSPELALTTRGSEYVASLLHRWLQECGPSDYEARPDLCLSVDVFRESITPAPRAVVRRLAEIEAGCQEIAARWDSL